MTKLLEWVAGGLAFLLLWAILIFNIRNYKALEDMKNFIYTLPLTIAAHFGVYAVTVVLWRVFTFNNCKEAAAELQNEINLAKEDLAKKGFKFCSNAS
ncbi:dolichol-phosphate mannosyltransferase subunit 3 [Bemisia tabaci]|uniref:dolichol-phosphate mannosyltransferase subunit 3 n=1 Tax=Bemisia tabaci TaxID=7038 RepID=UPI0008F99DF6|nr:PREDICTED: dolichol-phosphate mannosyltransferase subunit 3 [Bemisia tabaci]